MEIKSEQLWTIVRPRLRTYLGRTWDFGFVAKTTSSTVPTVTGWLADQTPPGERLIRLWHMLAAVGFESPELDALPSFNRYCGELLSFGVVDMKELQEICNLANPQGVLTMLRGTPPMRPQYTAEELREINDEVLQSMRSEIKPIDIAVPPKSSPRSYVHTGEPVMRTSVNGDRILVFTASQLLAALPLVRYLDSEECTAEDRSTLRRLVGNEEMFDLSNHLNNLCSERAREQGRSGKR